MTDNYSMDMLGWTNLTPKHGEGIVVRIKLIHSLLCVNKSDPITKLPPKRAPNDVDWLFIDKLTNSSPIEMRQRQQHTKPNMRHMYNACVYSF